MHSQSVVFIVAGAAATQRDLIARVDPLGIARKVCRSADEFLAALTPAGPSCVLAELPRNAQGDMHWLQRLARKTPRLPIVVIASHGDVPTAVAAMKLGILDFLETKCSDAQFGDAIAAAMRWDAENRRRIARIDRIRRRLARLNAGQRAVLDLLLAGKCNREAAAELKLSVRAIEERRAKVMQIMRAESLAELVRLAVLAESEGTSHGH
jgi:FixJ family two-component response regulator